MRTQLLPIVLLMSTACPAVDPPGDGADTGATSSTTMTPPDTPTTSSSSSSGSSAESTGTGAVNTSESGSTDESSTGDPSLCGNAILDPGEACDLGLDNSDVGYCKWDCTLAVCGDGQLWIGVEECDDPSSDGSYGGCKNDCTFAAYCGDGELHPSESCDAGPLNGTGEHEDGYVACGSTCGLEARRIFISSQSYSGNLGGLGGADLLCQNLAKAAGWSEFARVRAWLSDGTASPPSRYTETAPSLPFSLVNGRRIADDLDDLIASGPEDGIKLDEYGVSWSGELVWTNTAVAGGVFSEVDHCAGWLAAGASLSARTGLSAVSEVEMPQWAQNRWWTSMITRTCDKALRLYCLEI